MKRLRLVLLLAIFSLLNSTALIAEVKVNNQLADQWNQFVDDLLTLNHQITQATPHKINWRIGGYSNLEKFYDEATYISKEHKRITSILQWERADPSAIHSIEVRIYDDKGRVSEDFSAAYLTTHRNAPIQTLISLHYYKKGLHAFRVFDASHERIYEVCRGKHKGKTINIDLDDDYGELAEALEDTGGIMSSPAYKTCFGSRKVDMSRLKIPQL